jgi:CRP/FNR family cyclic AMP-dependent transcriptional regulator
VLRANEKVKLIESAPLFQRVSRRDLSMIAKLADELDLAEGKELTVEGQPGRKFFVLLEGTADMKRNGRKVNTMNAGDFFGEIALITEHPRTATVTAKTPVRVLVIRARDFRELMRRTPSMQEKVLQALADRLPPDL